MDDKHSELARRFHLTPEAVEAGRQVDKARSDPAEKRAGELVGIARRMGIELTMDAARARAAAEAQGKEGQGDGE